MPVNSRYPFLAANLEKYVKNFFIDASNEIKNQGRKAYYVTSKNTERLSYLKTTSLHGLMFDRDHLSCDEYYIENEQHLTQSFDMPADHYTAIYIHSTSGEKMVVHGSYPYDAQDIGSVTAKKFKNDIEIEVFKLTREDINEVRRHAQMYTEFRQNLRNDLVAELQQLEMRINNLNTEIAAAVYLLQQSDSVTLFSKYKQQASEKTKEILTILQIYNRYAQYSKYGVYRFFERYLTQLDQQNIALTQLATETSATNSDQVMLEPAPIIQQEKMFHNKKITPPNDLTEEIKNEIYHIKEIQVSSLSDAEKILKIIPIQKSLKDNLIILFCDNSVKNNMSRRNFIQEQENYLDTLQTVEDYFETCVARGNLEEVKILYPHLREKLEAGENKLFALFLKNLFPEKIGVAENLLEMADYFYEQNSPGFRLIIELQKLIYLTSITRHICSTLVHLFRENKIKSFTSLYKFNILEQKERPGMINAYVQYNIGQAVLLLYHSNPNIEFIKFLLECKYFNCLPDKRKLILVDVNAQPDFVRNELGFNDIEQSTIDSFVAIKHMDYFELAVYLAMNNKPAILDNVYYLATHLELERVIIGVAQITGSASFQTRMLVDAKRVESFQFFENKNDCDAATNEIRETGKSNFCIFGYVDKNADASFVALNKVLKIVMSRFLELDQEERYKFTNKYYEEIIVNKEKIQNKQRIKSMLGVALILSAASPLLTAKEYTLRLRLLWDNAVYVQHMGLGENADYLFSIAHHSLTHIPFNIMCDINSFPEDQASAFSFLKKCIFTKIKKLTNNPNAFYVKEFSLDVLLAHYKIERSESPKDSYELLLRTIAQQGNTSDMYVFFKLKAVEDAKVNINAYGQKSGKTALHQLFYAANRCAPEKLDAYRECYTLLWQNGAEASLKIPDAANQYPQDYDTKGIFRAISCKQTPRNF